MEQLRRLKTRHKIPLSETRKMNSGLREMDARLRRAFPDARERIAYIDARLKALEVGNNNQ